MPTPYCRCELALALADAASDVIETWESGDLAAAVTNLDEARKAFDLGFTGEIGCCPPATLAVNSQALAEPVMRFRAALIITTPRLCDPAGVALALVAACQSAQLDRAAPAEDPAVRLMACHLALICDASAETERYTPLIMECQRRAGVDAVVETGHE